MRHAQAIATSSAPAPSGTYSQAVVAPPFIFLSGQGPLDAATRELIEGSAEVQLRAIMGNLAEVAASAGASLEDAIRFGVYLADLGDIGIVNDVFTDLLSPPYPSRTTIQSDLRRFKVEVDCVLYNPSLHIP